MKYNFDYERKPEDVKAVQWNGNNIKEVDAFASDQFGKHDLIEGKNEITIHVNCYEEYKIPKGDYLVKRHNYYIILSKSTFKKNFIPKVVKKDVESTHYVNNEFD